jgi:hypothetical protein
VFRAKIADQGYDVNSPREAQGSRRSQGSRIWGCGGEDIVGRYGSANALEFKLPDRLDGDGVFDRHQNARANQNLTRFGFVAQPGCDIGHRPDGGVVEAPFEADGAQRGMSMRYADAEAEVVA